jgi:hypothetical protein
MLGQDRPNPKAASGDEPGGSGAAGLPCRIRSNFAIEERFWHRTILMPCIKIRPSLSMEVVLDNGIEGLIVSDGI